MSTLKPLPTVLSVGLFVLLSFGTAFNANPMTIRELRILATSDKKHGENFVNYYLVGTMEGTIEAHSHGVRSGAKEKICLNGRRLEPSMAKGLYERELQINEGVYEADMPVQLVMFNALETIYPCQ